MGFIAFAMRQSIARTFVASGQRVSWFVKWKCIGGSSASGSGLAKAMDWEGNAWLLLSGWG